MEVVRFDTEGTVANAMVALTKDGKPRVLLASFAKVYYARCDADCGKEASWSVAMIHDHANTKELTGRAFALDANGHPRFLIHTYRALFGIGQRTPQTELFACDAACDSPASWSATKVSDSIWYGSVLRYGAEGAVHVATTECAREGTSPKGQLLGYLTCTDGACTAPESFHGIGFGTPYENSSEAVAHKFTIDLELTRAGSPRVALIAKLDSAEKKVISYGECLAGKSCTAVDGWAFYGFDGGERIGAGLDLALDADDHPHIAYTSSYDIVSATCDEGCTDTTRAKTPWRSDVLREQTALLATDDIFLFPNCNVGAWLFANPAIALTQDGAYRATYEARDISGVLGPQDPTMPGCTAGTDMVLGRAAFY